MLRIRRPTMLLAAALLVVGIPGVGPRGSFCACAAAQGVQALQFGIGYDFKLVPFQGTTLSYQRFVGDRLAVRLGVEASLQSATTARAFDVADTSAFHAEEDVENGYHDYALMCQLIQYSGGRLSWYWGGGPKVTYSKTKNQEVRWESWLDDPSAVRYTDEWQSWAIGLSAVLGVRYHLNDTFALDAEYGASLMFGGSTRTTTRLYSNAEAGTIRDSYDSDTVELDGDDVRLGLTIFF